MWSIGNEIDYVNDPFPANSDVLPPIARRLIADVKELDTTRPVTAACAAIGTNLWYKDLDIIGYNYQKAGTRRIIRRLPGRVIFRFGEWDEPRGRGMPWRRIRLLRHSFCGRGLTTTAKQGGLCRRRRHGPERSRVGRVFGLAGFKKPMYYFRKSLWTDEPMVKIDFNLPVENQTDHSLSVPAGLACYTNCERVEFFQNGKTLGEVPLSADTRIIMVTANPVAGPIKAVGKRGGKAVAEDKFGAGSARR